MIDFLRPWALLLLPLCAAASLLLLKLLPATPPRALLRTPQRLRALLADLEPSDRRRRRRLYLTLATLGWLALALALAAPLSSGPPLRPVSGRDLLLAVDLSASMEARDVLLDGREVDRFSAVKTLAGEFIRGREGDRVGLIVFADDAYLLAPLTFDVAAVEGFLHEAVVGLAGQKTAIGDAIGLAVKTLQTQPAAARVMILLSDGDSNAGAIGPQKAVELAVANRVRVHTIGFGRASGDDSGDGGMAAIAAGSGGRHFTAPTTAALRAVYAELDLLEPTAEPTRQHLAERDWVYEMLLVALLMLTLLSVIDARRGRL